jgi:hypothetical protein
MATWCQGIGTKVRFTAVGLKSILCSSSSGGGLFGRPVTREGQGTLLNFGSSLFTISGGTLIKSYTPLSSVRDPKDYYLARITIHGRGGGSGSAEPSARASEAP